MNKKLFISALCAMNAALCFSQTPVYLDRNAKIEDRVEDALSRMTLEEKVALSHAQSKFSTAGVARLGIPELWMSDGPHGVRAEINWNDWGYANHTNDSVTAFPALTALAATWNPEMSALYGKAIGEEALYREKDVLLGPGVNIYRSPLNGRNFEYMGEDPYLASKMVVPYIQGLQSQGVAACVKHYALNNDEEYRHQVNVIVSDRALHEIYLPAFKAAVEQGKAWSIMGAYNLYKNQHNCHNAILLNKILKTDWKFDGAVISDWGGTHNTMEAITNGLDLEFGSWTNGLTMGASNAYDNYYLALPYRKLINEGKVGTKELDEKVRRVLRLHFRTTMDFSHHNRGSLCSEEHYATANKVATEGIVLLQNKNNVLPINPAAKRILVVGENAVKMMTVGGGSSSLKVQREVSPLDGLRKALAGKMQVDYARGYVGDVSGNYNGVTTGQNLDDKRSPEELIAEAVAKAKDADYVVFFGGLNKSDYQDCEGHDRKEYALPYGQDKVVEALAAVNKNVVYVNISGNCVAMPWKDKVSAILQGWFLGSEAGNGLASVLTGDVNPSGKLPFTWYAKLNDVGAHALNTYPGTWRENEKVIDEEYKEGIYVGYRWTEKKKIKPLFAFGHGLSYTTFKFGKATVNNAVMASDGEITVSVDVTNTGNKAGAEVVQLYVADKKASVDRPLKELKGFKKVFLQPGETKSVSITINKDALSFYDEATQSWKAEDGDFEALVGNSSDNISSKVAFKLK